MEKQDWDIIKAKRVYKSGIQTISVSHRKQLTCSPHISNNANTLMSRKLHKLYLFSQNLSKDLQLTCSLTTTHQTKQIDGQEIHKLYVFSQNLSEDLQLICSPTTMHQTKVSYLRHKTISQSLPTINHTANSNAHTHTHPPLHPSKCMVYLTRPLSSSTLQQQSRQLNALAPGINPFFEPRRGCWDLTRCIKRALLYGNLQGLLE